MSYGRGLDKEDVALIYNGILLSHKKKDDALAHVAQWIEHQPANQKVAGSIPGQGTCLGCEPGPQLGGTQKAATH